MTIIIDSNIPAGQSWSISLSGLISRFRSMVSLTWLMVLLEGIAFLAFPLVIGMALNDLLEGSYHGVKLLILLSLAELIIGTIRRFYDTRAYGKIYRSVSTELVVRERERGASTSAISARSQLFTEFVEFLEFSIPEISHNFINLAGTLVIIGFLHIKILWVCLAAVMFTVLIYWITSSRILGLNKGQNDEFEKQVGYISKGNLKQVRAHYHRLMGWKIKLSDLETINFFGVWLGLAAALVSAVILLGEAEGASVGAAVSIIMYVFGFIESVIAFPLYYQQLVRLKEISGRLQ